MPCTRIERIVKEEVGLTSDTALRLATFFDTTPEFWTWQPGEGERGRDRADQGDGTGGVGGWRCVEQTRNVRYMEVMERSAIINELRRLRPALHAEGVAHLALFGSRARGDNRPDSDIDLLIDIDPESRFSILNLVGVEHLVADATGLPANAFMRRSLDAGLAETAARDAIMVF